MAAPSPQDRDLFLPGQFERPVAASFTSHADSSQRTVAAGTDSDAVSPLSRDGDDVAVLPQHHDHHRDFKSAHVLEQAVSALPPPPRPHSPDPRGNEPSTASLWQWEIGASVLSLACMAAIIGVLSFEQNRPLDQWGLGQHISPTALVAFLGSVGKSACLLVLSAVISQLKWIHFSAEPQKVIDLETFDAASRGPWGGFVLVVLKHRRALLASMASLIMLTSLLIDPFLQLVFQFPVRLSVVDTNPPTIRSSTVYDPTGLEARTNARYYSASQVDAGMQSAILSPIFGDQADPSLPCSFERCDWPTITTLGACGSCTNLTETVQASCRMQESVSAAVVCNYTLPSLNVTLNATFGLVGGASDMAYYHTIWHSKTLFFNSTTPSVDTGTAHLAEFASISLDSDMQWQTEYIRGNTTDPILLTIPVQSAMHCKLDLCARTYETPSYANFTASALKGPKTTLRMPVDPWDAHLLNGTSVPNEPMYAELVPVTPNELPANASDSFRINYFDYGDMADYFADLFTVEYANWGARASSGNTGSTITPNIGLLLNEVDDMSKLMSAIGDSVTEAMRTGSNSTRSTGTGMNERTFIKVRWAWLALPMTLVVLTVTLFLLVALRARALAVPIWKSSSLALLFCQIDGWNRPAQEGLSLQELNERANNMSGRTGEGNNGVLVISKE